MTIPGTASTSSTNASTLLAALKNNASSPSSTDTSSTSANDPNNLASEQTFLQLFVAQLQNQDPLNPNEQDPTQMVSELAQFSELEQLVNIGQNVQSIDQAVAPASASASDSSSGPTTNQSNTANTNSSQSI